MTVLKDIEIQVGRTGALHAGRQARAGRRRRRDRAERDPAQRGLHQGHRRQGRDAARRPRHPHRRHRHRPARRRRHPADRRRGASTSGRKTPSPTSFPTKCPCPLHTDVVREETATGEEGARARCTGEFACPFQKIEHLKLFGSRRAFDIEGLGEKQIELFFEKGWVKEPADIFTLREATQERAPAGGRLRRDFGRAICSAPSKRAGRSRSTGSSMRSASAMSAKPRRWRWRAATARGRRSTMPA